MMLASPYSYLRFLIFIYFHVVILSSTFFNGISYSTLADGGVTTVNRWVENGVMVNETIFEPKNGGEKATMKRVFVRKA